MERDRPTKRSAQADIEPLSRDHVGFESGDCLDDPDYFPPDARDAKGALLELGAVVRILQDGPYLNMVGEVTGWGGRRGIEVILTDPDPELVAVAEDALVRLPVTRRYPIARTAEASRNADVAHPTV